LVEVELKIMNDKNHLRYVTAIFNKIVLDYGYEQIRKLTTHSNGALCERWVNINDMETGCPEMRSVIHNKNVTTKLLL
jgi:hypothetical protein